MSKRYIFKFTEEDPIIDAWLACQAKNNESFRALIYDIAKQYGAVDYTKKDLNAKVGRNKVHDILAEVSSDINSQNEPQVERPVSRPKIQENIQPEKPSNFSEKPVRVPNEISERKKEEPEQRPVQSKPAEETPFPFRSASSGGSIFERQEESAKSDPKESFDDEFDGALDDVMSLFND